MKQFALLISALLLTTYAFADTNEQITNENKTIVLDLEEMTRVAPMGMPEVELVNIEMETPAADDNEKELKYYKNWLGEKCIDFGTNEKLYYDWKRDFTYVGLPVFLLGWSLNADKKSFRSARHGFIGGFHTEIDNYTQFSPYAVILGLKALGYQGRSSWDRFLVSAAASNLVMAGIVNGIKYGAKEMRPDGSTKNSFPSGHTATAFAAATILHKEYGTTRSPWFSIGGYAVATATGFMRVMNNRHWVSDVISGAGIGILSTEIGYWIADRIYKNKGITHLELNTLGNPEKPTFFNIHMGIGVHSRELTFDEYSDNEYSERLVGDEAYTVKLGTSTVLGVEGAYFLNKYIGIGGLARVTTTPVKGLDMDSEDWDDLNFMNDLTGLVAYETNFDLPGVKTIEVSNDNLLDFSVDFGVYGNLPLSNCLSLGAKALAGARISKGFEYTATPAKFKRDATGNILNTAGDLFIKNNATNGRVALDDTKQGTPYKYIDVDGNSSFNYILGVSLTYNYKQNFAWKIFADFDSSKNKYRMNYNMYPEETINEICSNPASGLTRDDFSFGLNGKKFLNFWTFGAAFTITL